MQIPINFIPRPYQLEALTALDNGYVINVWCWARRGGKDKTAFGYAVKKMVEKPINVVLVFPTKEQGKSAFWENIENDGFKTIEAIPSKLIARQDNNNMRIVLKNGSTFEVMGTTDPDALRGANAKLYIFSEFVDIDSAALDVIRPIIAVNGGQIIIQSTPKIDGISGGTFKILFDRALKTAGQFASRITATEYLSADILEDLRQECIAKNGNDFMWRQEYMCDWGQTSSTSYYGAALQAMHDRHLIGIFPYEPALPVYTAWDLGTSDSTAMSFFQMIGPRPRIIDYFETHDVGYQPIINFLATKPYNLEHHFLPWDGTTREQSDATARIDKLQEMGLLNSSLLTRENKDDGIRQAVESIIKAEMNEPTTTELLRKLGLYKRKFNGITGDYEGPEHKTESHAADTIRYLFTAIRQNFDKTGRFLYAPSKEPKTYAGVQFAQPAYYQPNYY